MSTDPSPDPQTPLVENLDGPHRTRPVYLPVLPRMDDVTDPDAVQKAPEGQDETLPPQLD